jgi:hypothetical protein
MLNVQAACLDKMQGAGKHWLGGVEAHIKDHKGGCAREALLPSERYTELQELPANVERHAEVERQSVALSFLDGFQAPRTPHHKQRLSKASFWCKAEPAY